MVIPPNGQPACIDDHVVGVHSPAPIPTANLLGILHRAARHAPYPSASSQSSNSPPTLASASTASSSSSSWSTLFGMPISSTPVSSPAATAVPSPPPVPQYRCMTSMHQRPLSRDEKASLRQTVFLVHCAHCNTFFTDRGMKAVLLLKPHVTLYSTDAAPANCSPVYCPESLLGDEVPYDEVHKERTCNCLTQTMGCNGCGAVVGYNIISPCARCSRNVAIHAKGPNGHRIVFHCTEITTRIRRYVPGDRGVNAIAVPPRLTLLMEEQVLLQKQLHALSNVYGTASALIPKGTEQHARTLQHRLWHVTQQIRTMYNDLYERYQAGARMILAGESLSWADVAQGGERARPFSPDSLLEASTANR